MWYTVSSIIFGMSYGTAMYSALLGGAVTHSPSAGSRLGCRAELPGSQGFRVEPWAERGEAERSRRPTDGIERLPLLANSGNHRVFLVSLSQVCQRVSVEVLAWV